MSRGQKMKKPKNLSLRAGIWIFRIEIDGRRYKRSTGFRDQKAAELRALEIETELKKGAIGWTPKKCITFTEWAKLYQKNYIVRKKHPSRDRQMLAHALPFFGNQRLDEITQGDCERYWQPAPNGAPCPGQ